MGQEGNSGMKEKGKTKHRDLRIFWSIVKQCRFEKVMAAFAACFFLAALIIFLREPGIASYGDAMWYCFVACTSIGFGDMVAVTALGRIVTAILTIFELIVLALLSGVVVSHYLEVVHAREKVTATAFLDKMEHLTELDYDELKQIQDKASSLKL